MRGTLADPVIDVKSKSAISATGGLVVGRILGSALNISGAGKVMPGDVLGADSFPCEGVPGASNARPSRSAKAADGDEDQDQDETTLEALDKKVDKFFKGILGQ